MRAPLPDERAAKALRQLVERQRVSEKQFYHVTLTEMERTILVALLVGAKLREPKQWRDDLDKLTLKLSGKHHGTGHVG